MLRPVQNPPNPYESEHMEWCDGHQPDVRLEVYEEAAKAILSANQSPDIGFTYSLNPYRGCFHGCIYCYARPTHQYWSFGAGTDFDRRIVVKVNAPALLDRRLSARSWEGEAIAFSGNTDCYQPLEARYRLTRQCLEVCAARRNPVGIITKGTLIRRDLDVLRALCERAACQVTISLAFSDDRMRQVFDPYAPTVEARLVTIERLSAAGIDTGIALSPMIPGVNDSMIPELLERAKAAGARRAFMTPLRLARQVRPYFVEQLRERLPLRADKVLHGVRELRGGRENDPRFGHRMRGQGARWAMVQRLFEVHRRRLKMGSAAVGMELADLRAPPPQLRLPLL